MLFDELLAKIDDSGPRGYYSFETFMLNLLKSHIEQQDKQFMIEVDGWDAFAPQGFDELEGGTAIEIKFNIERTPTIQFFEKINWKLNKDSKFSGNIKNVLIICAKPFSEKFFMKFKEISTSNQTTLNKRIILWGPTEINKIVAKNKKAANGIVDNLFALRLESAVSKLSIDWTAEREERIFKLKDVFSKGQFSLFLGAGVSSSAGMPDWNTLLNSLFVSYLTKEFRGDEILSNSDISQIVERLNQIDSPSALLAARYIRKGLNKDIADSDNFINTITNNLYKLRNPERSIESQLILEIASMCMPKRTGAKVRSLVTYNFDDLIERQLESKSILHHSIYTENEAYDSDELPIYHVHGFLPENRKRYKILEKSTLVFSEEGYHHIYSNPYHWSNLVQLTNLREYHCLMVGLSMTDPNLRRLLEIASRNLEYPRHFAFMKRITSDSFNYQEKKGVGEIEKVITNERGSDKFLERHHKLNEEIMKELGVTIIWYEKHDEIPEFLREIRNY